MGTSSMIGILCENNVVKAIYCHFDGYLDHHGYLLHYFWRDTKKIASLLNTGDLCSLGVQLPIKDIQFAKEYAQGRHCIHTSDARIHISEAFDATKIQIQEIPLADYKCEQYNYYYVPNENKWYCLTGNRKHERIEVDLERYCTDKTYFEKINTLLGYVNVNDLAHRWNKMQVDIKFGVDCLAGKYNLMHNVAEELCQEFGMLRDTYTGAIVKQRGSDGEEHTEYVIYDILRAGQKRRSRLCSAANPLVCIHKAWTLLRCRLNNK